MVGFSLVIMKCPRQEILLFIFCGQKTFCNKLKDLDQRREGESVTPVGFICALECVNCMDYDTVIAILCICDGASFVLSATLILFAFFTILSVCLYPQFC